MQVKLTGKIHFLLNSATVLKGIKGFTVQCFKSCEMAIDPIHLDLVMHPIKESLCYDLGTFFFCLVFCFL